jgi:hypothetical protein
MAPARSARPIQARRHHPPDFSRTGPSICQMVQILFRTIFHQRTARGVAKKQIRLQRTAKLNE